MWRTNSENYDINLKTNIFWLFDMSYYMAYFKRETLYSLFTYMRFVQQKFRNAFTM